MDAAVKSEDGASAVEYSLIVVAIAAILVAVVFAIGGYTQANYHQTCSTWSSQSDAPPPVGSGSC